MYWRKRLVHHFEAFGKGLHNFSKLGGSVSAYVLGGHFALLSLLTCTENQTNVREIRRTSATAEYTPRDGQEIGKTSKPHIV